MRNIAEYGCDGGRLRHFACHQETACLGRAPQLSTSWSGGVSLACIPSSARSLELCCCLPSHSCQSYTLRHHCAKLDLQGTLPSLRYQTTELAQLEFFLPPHFYVFSRAVNIVSNPKNHIKFLHATDVLLLGWVHVLVWVKRVGSIMLGSS